MVRQKICSSKLTTLKQRKLAEFMSQPEDEFRKLIQEVEMAFCLRS